MKKPDDDAKPKIKDHRHKRPNEHSPSVRRQRRQESAEQRRAFPDLKARAKRERMHAGRGRKAGVQS